MNAPIDVLTPPKLNDVVKFCYEFLELEDCFELDTLGVLSDQFWILFADVWLSRFGLAVPKQKLQTRQLALRSIYRFEQIRRVAEQAPFRVSRQERAVISPLMCSLPILYDYYCKFTAGNVDVVFEKVIQFEVVQNSTGLGMRWSLIAEDIIGQFGTLAGSNRIWVDFMLTVVGFERGLCFEDDLFGHLPPLLVCHISDETPNLRSQHHDAGLECWEFDTEEFPQPGGMEVEVVTRGDQENREIVRLTITAHPEESDWYAYRSLSTL